MIVLFAAARVLLHFLIFWDITPGGLAACVNLLPGVTCVYRWQGAVDTADEVLLIIKTAATHADRVEAALQALHSYEIPEFLVLHPESVSDVSRVDPAFAPMRSSAETPLDAMPAIRALCRPPFCVLRHLRFVP
jgi:uncharacterized protein involved in tolerance to divalent cations